MAKLDDRTWWVTQLRERAQRAGLLASPDSEIPLDLAREFSPQTLLAFIDSDFDQSAAAALEAAVAVLSAEREWLLGPPEFIDEEEERSSPDWRAFRWSTAWNWESSLTTTALDGWLPGNRTSRSPGATWATGGHAWMNDETSRPNRTSLGTGPIPRAGPGRRDGQQGRHTPGSCRLGAGVARPPVARRGLGRRPCRRT